MAGNGFQSVDMALLRRLLRKDDFYQYIRTSFYQKEGNRKIKKACIKYPDADAHLFISLSFSARHCSSKPSILFGDWTIAYYYKYFLEKEPGKLREFAAIKRQNAILENADLVISLFPGITDYLKNYYKNPNIRYIGNVVNNIKAEPTDNLIEQKEKSNKILFIGSRRYRDGAMQLINAFTKIKEIYPRIELHIIGMTKGDLGIVDDQIFTYGYLDKGKTADRDLYYQLLEQAKVFVNTTDKWGAFSSMVEAMFYFTPVITTAYNEFVKTFGSEINFGYYSDAGPDTLYKLLAAVFSEKHKYSGLCNAAHSSVKNFTWDNYIHNFLQLVDGLNDQQPAL